MDQPSVLSVVLFALSLCDTGTASTVAVYKDKDCKSPISNSTASNGYPDGQCTSVTEQAGKKWESFMFLSLNDGCTPTVYGADAGQPDDSCSGPAIVASPFKCYNTTWVEFSVDECLLPKNATGGTASNATGTTGSTPTTSPTEFATGSTSTSTMASGASPSEMPKSGGLSIGTVTALGLGLLFL